MCFHILGLARIQPYACIHLFHQDSLSLAARGHDAARRVAILIHARTHNDAMNRISVFNGFVQQLENDSGNALTPGVTVAARVESVTVSVWVDHPEM